MEEKMDWEVDGHRLEGLGPEEMLREWALRTVGSSMKSPIPRNTLEHWGSGRALLDDELQLVAYVQGVAGFADCHRCLRHKWVDDRSVSSYPYRGPGQLLSAAARLHGQRDLYLKLVKSQVREKRKARTAGRREEGQEAWNRKIEAILIRSLYDGFVMRLEARLALEPFKVKRVAELDLDRLVTVVERAVESQMKTSYPVKTRFGWGERPRPRRRKAS